MYQEISINRINAVPWYFEEAIIAQKSLALSLDHTWLVNLVSDVEDQSFQTKRSLLKKMVLAVAAATWISMD